MIKINNKLKDKIIESVYAVLPITLIVFILSAVIVPDMPSQTFLLFIFGAVLLIFGMGLFSLGAEMSMMPIGERLGKQLTKSKKLWMVILSCFIIGVIITVAEPDLTVLATQIPSIPNFVLIISVAIGVGIFLVIATLRIMYNWNLSLVLMISYLAAFVLALFVPVEFWAIAFDSGGVTTGPITVPFIMSLGLGLTAMLKSKNSSSDSFGLVGLCSIGPIATVLVLGLIYGASSGEYVPPEVPLVNTTSELWFSFGSAMPHYAKEVALALIPILLFFLVFQIFFFNMPKTEVAKILIGQIYTFVGLSFFLVGANIGFMPVGNFLGVEIAKLDYNWILIPIGMIVGYFIVRAEPAVGVLNRQVEEVTSGSISQKTMMTGLSIGMAISIGLSMVRILTGISIFTFILPGYAIALGLSLVVPKIITSIAFDSGGVASGPMTATFLLSFSIGATETVGGNILTDAFGVVAMVAMTPMIIIQLIGLYYKIREFQLKKRVANPITAKKTDIISQPVSNVGTGQLTIDDIIAKAKSDDYENEIIEFDSKEEKK